MHTSMLCMTPQGELFQTLLMFSCLKARGCSQSGRLGCSKGFMLGTLSQCLAVCL
jgi:hypothetical protein